MKKIFSIVLLITIIVINPIYASSNFSVSINNSIFKVKSASVKVNGEKLNPEFKPYIKNGRTFVPIRDITEKLGADVSWNNLNKSITISLDNNTIKMQVDSPTVFVNNKKINVGNDQAPQLALYQYPRKETKTMVPLRFISETFDYEVDWDNDEIMAAINTFKSANLTYEDKKSNIQKVSLNNNSSLNKKFKWLLSI